MTHPNIIKIKVVGVNDPVKQEEICAWVKLREPGKTSVEDLLKYAKGQIAPFKIPRYFRFVNEYPTTVTGKVRKN